MLIGSAAAAITLATAITSVATADPPPVPGTGLVVKDSQPDYAWDSAYIAQAVSFPSRRSGAILVGTLYGPKNLAALGKLPAVVVIPPSGGAATQGSVSYLAKFLAGDGFIGLTVDPQGIGDSDTFGDNACGDMKPGRANPLPCDNVPYQQMDNFFDAGQSALDFLLGPGNPWRKHVDPHRVGATGHSEGARAATYLQDPRFDGRVQAVVALDNLTTSYCGDMGTPSNEGPGGGSGVQNAVINGEPDCLTQPGDPDFVVRPVAPALGLASDGAGGFGQDAPAGTTAGPPDEKKTAFLAWRAAGLPSMELVLAGVNHNQFSQTSTSNDALLHEIALYTDAWFDRWLDHDDSATGTLTACSVLGTPLTTLLSTSYRSAVFLPHQTDVEDLRAACAASG